MIDSDLSETTSVAAHAESCSVNTSLQQPLKSD